MKNLKLKDLKVQSFVTTLNKENQKTIMAGEGQSDNVACDRTEHLACGPHTCGGFMGDGRHFAYCVCPNPESEIVC